MASSLGLQQIICCQLCGKELGSILEKPQCYGYCSWACQLKRAKKPWMSPAAKLRNSEPEDDVGALLPLRKRHKASPASPYSPRISSRTRCQSFEEARKRLDSWWAAGLSAKVVDHGLREKAEKILVRLTPTVPAQLDANALQFLYSEDELHLLLDTFRVSRPLNLSRAELAECLCCNASVRDVMCKLARAIQAAQGIAPWPSSPSISSPRLPLPHPSIAQCASPSSMRTPPISPRTPGPFSMDTSLSTSVLSSPSGAGVPGIKGLPEVTLSPRLSPKLARKLHQEFSPVSHSSLASAPRKEECTPSPSANNNIPPRIEVDLSVPCPSPVRQGSPTSEAGPTKTKSSQKTTTPVTASSTPVTPGVAKKKIKKKKSMELALSAMLGCRPGQAGSRTGRSPVLKPKMSPKQQPDVSSPALARQGFQALPPSGVSLDPTSAEQGKDDDKGGPFRSMPDAGSSSTSAGNNSALLLRPSSTNPAPTPSSSPLVRPLAPSSSKDGVAEDIPPLSTAQGPPAIEKSGLHQPEKRGVHASTSPATLSRRSVPASKGPKARADPSAATTSRAPRRRPDPALPPSQVKQMTVSDGAGRVKVEADNEPVVRHVRHGGVRSSRKCAALSVSSPRKRERPRIRPRHPPSVARDVDSLAPGSMHVLFSKTAFLEYVATRSSVLQSKK